MEPKDIMTTEIDTKSETDLSDFLDAILDMDDEQYSGVMATGSKETLGHSIQSNKTYKFDRQDIGSQVDDFSNKEEYEDSFYLDSSSYTSSEQSVESNSDDDKLLARLPGLGDLIKRVGSQHMQVSSQLS
jgi:hypothetical protein